MIDQQEPTPPPSLDVADYALPEDRRTLARLRKLEPFVYATRMFVKHLGEPMVRAQLLGGAVRVSRRQFPHLAALAERCAAMLHMEAPEVFVVQDPRLNSYTYGHEKPLVILTSGLVDAMTEEEIAFVMGHEFGHIKSEHVLFVNLAEFLRTGAAVAVQWLAAPALLALFAWQRLAEQTADRAGLISCGRPQDAEAALIKLALGSATLFSQVDVEEYLSQADGLSSGTARLAQALQNHPYTAQRVKSLRGWAGSDGYRAIWDADRRPTTDDRRPEDGATGLAGVAERVGVRAAEAVVAGESALRRTRDNLRGILGGSEASDDAATARPDEEPV